MSAAKVALEYGQINTRAEGGQTEYSLEGAILVRTLRAFCKHAA